MSGDMTPYDAMQSIREHTDYMMIYPRRWQHMELPLENLTSCRAIRFIVIYSLLVVRPQFVLSGFATSLIVVLRH
jgi:hypothetical protein